MSGSGWVLWGCVAVLVLRGGLFVCGDINPEDDEWVDPFDMLNYDSVSKRMRKTESPSYVPTKRREYSQGSCQVDQCPDVKGCTDKIKELQREIEEVKKKAVCSSHHQTCNPVFKRFLTKLLKGIEKLGLPSALTAEKHYDAEVKLSKKMVTEIQKLVTDENSWTTGAMDDALSQILVNFKHHDYEAWKWRFEDTFGVDLNTVLKMLLFILLIVIIICTEIWSVVSWFVQFKRMFAICFVFSLVWNWFYLYQTAFAEHKAKMMKVEDFNDKCTGVKRFDWKDNLKEWYRTTWTFQDDPCKEYYEVLLVNPILLVPPTKALTITFTSFITDPLKQLGQGISEFLRALLKDQPITLQIPVLILIMVAVLVFIYSSCQAAVHHAVHRPLQGGRQDPPPGILQQPAAPCLREREEHPEAERHANFIAEPWRRARQEGNRANYMGNGTHQEENRQQEVRQRRPDRLRREQRRVYVETLRNTDSPNSGDETDNQQKVLAEVPDHHVVDEAQTLSHRPNEENESCASNPETKQTPPTSKGHSAGNDSKHEKTSGNPERKEEGESACVGGNTSKNEECIENIGSPVQDTMQ